MENIVIVDEKGFIKGFKRKKDLLPDDIVAVELVMVYIRDLCKVVLFNRGKGASDMRDHWALESGKVCSDDLDSLDYIGEKLSINAFRNAAVREFIEELDFKVLPDAFYNIASFYLEKKRIYFTLLSLSLEEEELPKLVPDQSEIDKLKLFTLEEFDKNKYLGDAIVFRKDKIIAYLQKIFGEC